MDEVKETIVEPKDEIPEVVPRDEFLRVKQDMHKYKEKMREFEEKLKTARDSELKKNQQWEEYAKLKEREAHEALQEREAIQKALILEKKLDALRSAAIENGMRKEALADLDLMSFDDVQIETTSTGRINVLGAEDAIKRLKTLRPFWFKSHNTNINSTTPEVLSGQKVTIEALFKAEEVAKKSGDYTQYKTMLAEYAKQKQ